MISKLESLCPPAHHHGQGVRGEGRRAGNGSGRKCTPRDCADSFAGCRAGRRGVELGAECPRVARRVL